MNAVRQLYQFERSLFLSKPNLLVLIILLVWISAFNYYFLFVRLASISDIDSELIASIKFFTLTIVFYQSLRRFHFFKSHVSYHAICAVRSHQFVFRFQVLNHLVQIVLLSTILFLLSAGFYYVRVSQEQFLVYEPLDLFDLYLRVMAMAILGGACSLIFVLYYTRTWKFVLAIYLIPQVIMSCAYVLALVFKTNVFFLNPIDLPLKIVRIDVDYMIILLSVFYVALLVYLSGLTYRLKRL